MTVLASDNFDRADANPIGGNWTTLSGLSALQIVSNTCQPSSLAVDCGASYSGTWPDDQYAQVKVTVNSTGGGVGIGLVCRVNGGNFYRLVADHAAANNIELGKFTPGFANIWTRTQAFTDGDTLRLEVQGTTLRVFINGVQVGADSTDSSLASGNPGIAYSAATSATTLVDDWEAGDLGANLMIDPAAQRPPGRISPAGRWTTIIYDVPPVAAAAVPDYVPQWATARPRRADQRPRRGEFFATVPALVVAAAPDWVAPIIQPNPPKRPVQRRGDFLVLPLPILALPLPIVATVRRRQPSIRRGEFLPIVPVPAVLAGPGPWLPAQLTHRRTPAQTRRAEWFLIPLVGASPAAPPAVVPPFITHRPYRPLVRRGRYQPTPATQPSTPPPLLVARRRPAPGRPHGTHLWPLPPSAPPPGPGPWPPRITQATRRQFARRSPRAQFWPFLLGAFSPVVLPTGLRPRHVSIVELGVHVSISGDGRYVSTTHTGRHTSGG